MKKRNPFFVSLLSAATLGFYYSYWLFDIQQQLTKKDLRIPSPLPATIAHLSVIVGIACVVFTPGGWDAVKNGVAIPLFIIFIGAAAIILLSYWFHKFCTAIKTVADVRTLGVFDYPVVLFLHYFLLFFVWAGLAQNEFNKLDKLSGSTVAKSGS